MSSTEELTSGNGLAPFIVLAKSAKGKGINGVITQVLAAPNIYVFGELLALPNIQQLGETEDRHVLELLQIFAYGKYSDYKAQGGKTTLTPQQEKKLRQLTIVSLSAQAKIIPYNTLQKELEITELRELEDLIIDAIYQGVITGQLDQKHHCLEVESTMGRDLKPSALDDILQTLTNWTNQAESLLTTVKEKIDHANRISVEEKANREELTKKIDTAKVVIRNAESDFGGGGYHGHDMDTAMDHEDRGRKGRKHMNKHGYRDHFGGGRKGFP